MPDGKTHYYFFKIGYISVIPTSLYLMTLNPVFGIANFLGYSFHRFVDNDADLMGTSSSEGRLVNELKFVGAILFGFLSVYGAIFRRYHRSIITHFPFLSTAIRLAFVFWWIPLLYYFKLITYRSWQLDFLIWFWVGLSQADATHYIADLFFGDAEIPAESKKKKPKRKKKRG
jgi:uncharacterized metal-binding protein